MGFELISDKTKYTEKFRMTTREIVFQFTPGPFDLKALQKEIFSILEPIKQRSTDFDRIGVMFSCNATNGPSFKRFVCLKPPTMVLDAVSEEISDIFSESNDTELSTLTLSISKVEIEPQCVTLTS